MDSFLVESAENLWDENLGTRTFGCTSRPFSETVNNPSAGRTAETPAEAAVKKGLSKLGRKGYIDSATSYHGRRPQSPPQRAGLAAHHPPKPLLYQIRSTKLPSMQSHHQVRDTLGRASQVSESQEESLESAEWWTGGCQWDREQEEENIRGERRCAKEEEVYGC